jgi:hypothetical protein
MSKYSPLSEHLESRESSPWTASFQEIEKILGFKLPKSAFQYAPWWANSKDGHSQSSSWQKVGWETSDLDLENQHVTFRLNITDFTRNIKPYFPDEITSSNPLTIDEAKLGLSAHFGVSMDNIEIIIRG